MKFFETAKHYIMLSFFLSIDYSYIFQQHIQLNYLYTTKSIRHLINHYLTFLIKN